jgi:type VI secretion system secreted protein VgrG
MRKTGKCVVRRTFVFLLCAGVAMEAYSATKPSISRVLSDPASELLFIHGDGFDEESAVWLEGVRLHVLAATGTLIEAELPPRDPGTYLLIVSREGAHFPRLAGLAAMDVTLGAVGPAGPRGAEGAPGERGEIGAPGQDGSTWFSGDGPPPSGLGKPGDFYLDQTSGDVHRNDGSWRLVASLVGPRGPAGPGPASDPREEVAALLGIDAAELGVPLLAVTSAECGAGAAVSLTTDGGSPGAVVGLAGYEAISAPFRFLVAVRSSRAFDPSSLVGGGASILISNLSTSTVTGIVTAVDLGGTMEDDALFILTIEPVLSRAASFSGFAAFERMTAVQVVQRVLLDFAVPVSFNVLGFVPQREYEAQWNERSLDFVRRLMEREGLHFHFGDDGTMVVGNDNVVFGLGPSLPYLGHFADPDGGETVSSFRTGASPSPGEVTVRGWDYSRKQTVVGSAMSSGSGEIFTFFPDVDQQFLADARARTILARERARAFERTGTSNSPAIHAGKQIRIGGAGGAFNGSYLVTGVRHVLHSTDGCFAYGNQFTALPSEVAFQPEEVTPVPRIAGTVSARVTFVGNQNELYRVKVRFPWLENSQSGWARVAVPIVGAGFALPEVDDEVLVAFDHGDIRFPVVIGTLWNGVDRPPTIP